jgi:hypothetical protein
MKLLATMTAAAILATTAAHAAQDETAKLLARRTAAECLYSAATGQTNADAPKAPNGRMNRVCWCIANSIVAHLTAAEIHAAWNDPSGKAIPMDARAQKLVDDCTVNLPWVQSDYQ